MADPISEIQTATRTHFMPVVTNQLYQESPALYRIFRLSKEGEFGMALPSFDGRAIAEPLELGSVAEEQMTFTSANASATNGQTAVTLASGTFPADIANRGYVTMPDGKSYAIVSRDSATQISLATPYEGQSGSGLTINAVYYSATSNAVGAYGRDTVWGAGSGEVLGAAEFKWKMYHATIKIHNLDSQVNRGRERILNIVALKLRNAMRGLRAAMAKDFYSTNTDAAVGMIGLRAVVAKTGVVGGIDKRKYEFWQGHLQNASSGALNWALLNDMWYKTKMMGLGDPATVIFCSPGVIQKYEDNLSKVVVTGTEGAAYPNVYLQMQADKASKVIDGGFRAFSFKGIPIVSDPYCPSGYAFFVNENYIHWRVLKAFDNTPWVDLRGQGMDWAQTTILGYGALTVSCCKKFGGIYGLAES